jgi:hypothetical protein
MHERPDVDLNLIKQQLSGIKNYLKEKVWKTDTTRSTEGPSSTPFANPSEVSISPNELPTSQNQ